MKSGFFRRILPIMLVIVAFCAILTVSAEFTVEGTTVKGLDANNAYAYAPVYVAGEGEYTSVEEGATEITGLVGLYSIVDMNGEKTLVYVPGDLETRSALGTITDDKIEFVEAAYDFVVGKFSGSGYFQWNELTEDGAHVLVDSTLGFGPTFLAEFVAAEDKTELLVTVENNLEGAVLKYAYDSTEIVPVQELQTVAFRNTLGQGVVNFKASPKFEVYVMDESGVVTPYSTLAPQVSYSNWGGSPAKTTINVQDIAGLPEEGWIVGFAFYPAGDVDVDTFTVSDASERVDIRMGFYPADYVVTLSPEKKPTAYAENGAIKGLIASKTYMYAPITINGIGEYTEVSGVTEIADAAGLWAIYTVGVEGNSFDSQVVYLYVGSDHTDDTIGFDGTNAPAYANTTAWQAGVWTGTTDFISPSLDTENGFFNFYVDNAAGAGLVAALHNATEETLAEAKANIATALEAVKVNYAYESDEIIPAGELGQVTAYVSMSWGGIKFTANPVVKIYAMDDATLEVKDYAYECSAQNFSAWCGAKKATVDVQSMGIPSDSLVVGIEIYPYGNVDESTILPSTDTDKVQAFAGLYYGNQTDYVVKTSVLADPEASAVELADGTFKITIANVVADATYKYKEENATEWTTLEAGVSEFTVPSGVYTIQASGLIYFGVAETEVYALGRTAEATPDVYVSNGVIKGLSADKSYKYAPVYINGIGEYATVSNATQISDLVGLYAVVAVGNGTTTNDSLPTYVYVPGDLETRSALGTITDGKIEFKESAYDFVVGKFSGSGYFTWSELTEDGAHVLVDSTLGFGPSFLAEFVAAEDKTELLVTVENNLEGAVLKYAYDSTEIVPVQELQTVAFRNALGQGVVNFKASPKFEVYVMDENGVVTPYSTLAPQVSYSNWGGSPAKTTINVQTIAGLPEEGWIVGFAFYPAGDVDVDTFTVVDANERVDIRMGFYPADYAVSLSPEKAPAAYAEEGVIKGLDADKAYKYAPITINGIGEYTAVSGVTEIADLAGLYSIITTGVEGFSGDSRPVYLYVGSNHIDDIIGFDGTNAPAYANTTAWQAGVWTGTTDFISPSLDTENGFFNFYIDNAAGAGLVSALHNATEETLAEAKANIATALEAVKVNYAYESDEIIPAGELEKVTAYASMSWGGIKFTANPIVKIYAMDGATLEVKDYAYECSAQNFSAWCGAKKATVDVQSMGIPSDSLVVGIEIYPYGNVDESTILPATDTDKVQAYAGLYYTPLVDYVVAREQIEITGLTTEAYTLLGLDEDLTYTYAPVYVNGLGAAEEITGVTQIDDICGFYQIIAKGDGLTAFDSDPVYIYIPGDYFERADLGNYDDEGNTLYSNTLNWKVGEWTGSVDYYDTSVSNADGSVFVLLDDYVVTPSVLNSGDADAIAALLEARSFKYAYDATEVIPVGQLDEVSFYSAQCLGSISFKANPIVKVYVADANGEVSAYSAEGALSSYSEYQGTPVKTTVDVQTIAGLPEEGFVVGLEFYPCGNVDASTIKVTGSDKVQLFVGFYNEFLEGYKISLERRPTPTDLYLEDGIVKGLDQDVIYKYAPVYITGEGEYTEVEEGAATIEGLKGLYAIVAAGDDIDFSDSEAVYFYVPGDTNDKLVIGNLTNGVPSYVNKTAWSVGNWSGTYFDDAKAVDGGYYMFIDGVVAGSKFNAIFNAADETALENARAEVEGLLEAVVIKYAYDETEILAVDELNTVSFYAAFGMGSTAFKANPIAKFYVMDDTGLVTPYTVTCEETSFSEWMSPAKVVVDVASTTSIPKAGWLVGIEFYPYGDVIRDTIVATAAGDKLQAYVGLYTSGYSVKTNAVAPTFTYTFDGTNYIVTITNANADTKYRYQASGSDTWVEIENATFVASEGTYLVEAYGDKVIGTAEATLSVVPLIDERVENLTIEDGVIKGLDANAAYEYAPVNINGVGAYVAIPAGSTEYTFADKGLYVVRIKATSTAPASFPKAFLAEGAVEDRGTIYDTVSKGNYVTLDFQSYSTAYAPTWVIGKWTGWNLDDLAEYGINYKMLGSLTQQSYAKLGGALIEGTLTQAEAKEILGGYIFRYAYDANEIIPLAELKKMTFETGARQGHISADDVVNASFTVFVSDRYGNISKRELVLPYSFTAPAATVMHTVSGESFADNSGYIVGIEITPFADIPETTNLVVAEDTTGSDFVVVLDTYEIVLPAIEAPSELVYNAETGLVEGLDANASYYYNNYSVNGAGEIVEVTGVTTLELGAGVWGIGLVSSDANFSNSEPIIVFIPGTEAEKLALGNMVTIPEPWSEGEYVGLDFVDGDVWAQGKWSGAQISSYPAFGEYGLSAFGGHVTAASATALKTAIQNQDAAAEAAARKAIINLANDIKFRYAFANEEIVPTSEFYNISFTVAQRQGTVNLGVTTMKVTFYTVDATGEVSEYVWTREIYSREETNVSISPFDILGWPTDEYVVGFEIRPWTNPEAEAIKLATEDISNSIAMITFLPEMYVLASENQVTETPALVVDYRNAEIEIANYNAYLDYVYSIDGGATWNDVNGGVIKVEKPNTTYVVKSLAKGAFVESAVSESIVGPKVIFVGTSLVLDGQIGIKVYLDMDLQGVEKMVYTMDKVNKDYAHLDVNDPAYNTLYTVTLDTTLTEGTEWSTPIVYDEATGLYYTIIYLAAKDLDNVYFETGLGYWLEGEETTPDNKIIVSTEQLSFGKYIAEAKALAEAGDAAFVEALPLIEATETYANYADNYFNNGSLEAYTAANAIVDFADPSRTSGVLDGATFYATSLLLEDKVTIRHYFAVTDINAFKANYTCDIEYGVKGNFIYFDIDDIPAQEIGDVQTLTIKNTDGTTAYEITYSVGNYIEAMAGDTNASLVSLVNAMYDYYVEADKYTK